MILDNSKADTSNLVMLPVPNGGYAVLDGNGSMIAYNKDGEPKGNDWSWVRANCKK